MLPWITATVGVKYWDTYEPVVSWSSIRILMMIAKLHNLHTKSVDFVRAYLQAAIKSYICLRPPCGALLNDNGDKVLKLLKNLYGLKGAVQTWFEHLTDGFSSMGCMATPSDLCIFTKGTNIIILYVDDFIIMFKTKEEVDALFS